MLGPLLYRHPAPQATLWLTLPIQQKILKRRGRKDAQSFAENSE
jgi:hypothetical protein